MRQRPKEKRREEKEIKPLSLRELLIGLALTMGIPYWAFRKIWLTKYPKETKLKMIREWREAGVLPKKIIT